MPISRGWYLKSFEVVQKGFDVRVLFSNIIHEKGDYVLQTLIFLIRNRRGRKSSGLLVQNGKEIGSVRNSATINKSCLSSNVE